MSGQVLVLSGGVGGAKLALGLSKILEPEELLIVANTGDDFEHMGFYICPDIDTLLYTLGGVSNTETGWGRAEETWSFMQNLQQNHPEQAWFQLGDKDLETHRYRTEVLASGKTLTEVTASLARRFQIGASILPMTDDPMQTFVLAESDAGKQWLPFQEYFVRQRCEPRICSIEFRGRDNAALSPQLEGAITGGRIRAVVLCPSNPYLSIDPILAVPGMKELLRACKAPVIAVSPVVDGKALKGPTTKIMQELGLVSDVTTIAEHYRGIVDGLVIDEKDSGALETVQAKGISATATNTIMLTLEDRIALARDVLKFAVELAG